MSSGNVVEQALDYQQFKGWLSSQESLVIGMPQNANVCPLAVYLRETVPALSQVWVKRHHIDYRMGVRRGRLPLPQWAVAFVKGVDKVSAPLEAEAAIRLLPPLELLPAEAPKPTGLPAVLRGLRLGFLTP